MTPSDVRGHRASDGQRRPCSRLGTRDGRNPALRLVAVGYMQVNWYRGGREAWQVNGYPKLLSVAKVRRHRNRAQSFARLRTAAMGG